MDTELFEETVRAMTFAYAWTSVGTGDNYLVCGNHVQRFAGSKPSVGDRIRVNPDLNVEVRRVVFDRSWRVEIVDWPHRDFRTVP